VELQKEQLQGDTIVEEGTYKLVATAEPSFAITHLVLNSGNGSKRVWRLQELSEKDVSFKIEKFN
jgi:hypothetical protein